MIYTPMSYGPIFGGFSVYIYSLKFRRRGKMDKIVGLLKKTFPSAKYSSIAKHKAFSPT